MTKKCETTEKNMSICANFVIKKECEFRHTVSQPYKQKLTGDDLLKQVCAGKYFGAVVCDINVPENLKTNFAEMPPMF